MAKIVPNEIKKLDTAVINRIAAGEVIQRPANALKELIENSLDAHSTNIRVTVKDGGLKLLQIQDNGCGIRKEDFEIVCERFTTSKLKKFEDLEEISTYGFRGEALASISFVSHLTILSKIIGSQCAYQASYKDGVIIGKPRPIAGNQGTIISVADLFYNMSVRRTALRSPAEEFSKICDVVGKYAIHNFRVGFTLKNSESVEICTMVNSNPVDNIKVVYGQDIAKQLMDFQMENNAYEFKVTGQITNVNYSSKKNLFVLFINHRLVDCQNLKRRINQIYATYLPKNMHPFVYLSLEIKPNNVDVNVHPTKHEVHFVNEDEIVDLIGRSIENKLLGSNNTRTFYTERKLPVSVIKFDDTAANKTIYDKDLVRTDYKQSKLESFVQPLIDQIVERAESQDRKLLDKSVLTDSDNHEDQKEFRKNAKAAKKKDTTTKNRVKHNLKSIIDLSSEIEINAHANMRKLFAEHVFVGVLNSRYAAIQHDVTFLIVDTQTVMEELFYQCVIFNFGNFNVYEMKNKLSVEELALIALNEPETGWTEEDGEKNELATRVKDILIENSEMLRTYFEIDIDSHGNICALPILIDGHAPLPGGLPRYLLRLACEVNWEEERACFDSFARETAVYYAEPPHLMSDDWKSVVEHKLYPFMKEYFLPPAAFQTNGAITQATTLPELYKVFERC